MWPLGQDRSLPGCKPPITQGRRRSCSAQAQSSAPCLASSAPPLGPLPQGPLSAFSPLLSVLSPQECSSLTVGCSPAHPSFKCYLVQRTCLVLPNGDSPSPRTTTPVLLWLSTSPSLERSYSHILPLSDHGLWVLRGSSYSCSCPFRPWHRETSRLLKDCVLPGTLTLRHRKRVSRTKRRHLPQRLAPSGLSPFIREGVLCQRPQSFVQSL